MKNLLFSAEGDEPIPGVGGFQKENGGSRLNAAIDNELITIKAYLNGLGPSDQKTEFISHVSLWNRSARDAVLAVSDYKKSLDPADYDNIGTFGLSNQAALPSYLKTVFVENAEDLIKTVAVYLNEQGRKEDAVKFYSLYGPALVDENQVQAMVTDYQNLNINVALINANASPILNEGVAVVLESVGTPYWIATRNAVPEGRNGTMPTTADGNVSWSKGSPSETSAAADELLQDHIRQISDSYLMVINAEGSHEDALEAARTSARQLIDGTVGVDCSGFVVNTVKQTEEGAESLEELTGTDDHDRILVDRTGVSNLATMIVERDSIHLAKVGDLLINAGLSHVGMVAMIETGQSLDSLITGGYITNDDKTTYLEENPEGTNHLFTGMSYAQSSPDNLGDGTDVGVKIEYSVFRNGEELADGPTMMRTSWENWVTVGPLKRKGPD